MAAAMTLMLVVLGAGNAWACTSGDSAKFAIRSESDRRYVSAELGKSGNVYGVLRARATTVGPWERFRVRCLGWNAIAIQSLANGRYVAAELGYKDGLYGLLRARATTVGPWERFSLPSADYIHNRYGFAAYLGGPNGAGVGSDFGTLKANRSGIGSDVFSFLPIS
jgi:hypothetical protein